MNVFDKHQIKIARSTLKMSDVGATIMGGMTKDEARAVLRKHASSASAAERQIRQLEGNN